MMQKKVTIKKFSLKFVKLKNKKRIIKNIQCQVYGFRSAS